MCGALLRFFLSLFFLLFVSGGPLGLVFSVLCTSVLVLSPCVLISLKAFHLCSFLSFSTCVLSTVFKASTPPWYCTYTHTGFTYFAFSTIMILISIQSLIIPTTAPSFSLKRLVWVCRTFRLLWLFSLCLGHFASTSRGWLFSEAINQQRRYTSPPSCDQLRKRWGVKSYGPQ